MSRGGKELVDGRGAARVVERLFAVVANGAKQPLMRDCDREDFATHDGPRDGRSGELILRPVCEDDCRLVWEWANDPDVRAVSFSSDPISWSEHINWFTSKLSDARCIFWIATNFDKQPVGLIRYDIEGAEAVVSIIIDRKFRGRGYGTQLIAIGAHELFASSSVRTIHAYAKSSNTASLRAFEKAGFRNLGRTAVGKHEAVHLILVKDGDT